VRAFGLLVITPVQERKDIEIQDSRLYLEDLLEERKTLEEKETTKGFGQKKGPILK